MRNREVFRSEANDPLADSSPLIVPGPGPGYTTLVSSARLIRIRCFRPWMTTHVTDGLRLTVCYAHGFFLLLLRYIPRATEPQQFHSAPSQNLKDGSVYRQNRTTKVCGGQNIFELWLGGL